MYLLVFTRIREKEIHRLQSDNDNESPHIQYAVFLGENRYFVVGIDKEGCWRVNSTVLGWRNLLFRLFRRCGVGTVISTGFDRNSSVQAKYVS